VTVTRDIVRTGACNTCHDSLAAHGGSRRSFTLCVMCHQNQTVDPNTGNNLAADVFFHALHYGSSLPTVVAGTPYEVVGHNQTVENYSTVVYPPQGGVLACTTCHNPSQGATQQNDWMTVPNREACGSCHDNVNFATGLNHENLPEVSDSQCAGCHIPQGQLEFDASVIGAHTIAAESPLAPGINLAITNVTNGVAGKAPLVTFTIKDNSGAPITMAQMTGSPNSLSLTMAGPTHDYGYTSFGSTVTTPGYVTESVAATAQCNTVGTCTYQFTHSIPSTATGTYAIGMEGRRSLAINPGTTDEVDTEYGATNVVYYFSVDGSPVTPRRTVVALANCNQCHVQLSLHGGLRNQPQYCVFCHNPSDTDASMRPSAVVASDKTAPAQGINFAYMIHRIHSGVNLVSQGATYTIVGYGGSHNDFTTVLYPSLSPTGAVSYTQSCYRCHTGGSEAKFPIGLNQVTNPSALVSPVGPTTSACTACHATDEDMGHALQQTNAEFGETCDVCHSGTAEFNVQTIHVPTTGTVASARSSADPRPDPGNMKR
jgi:OmcA/MtrC family decaheme c-type cytochrome